MEEFIKLSVHTQKFWLVIYIVEKLFTIQILLPENVLP